MTDIKGNLSGSERDRMLEDLAAPDAYPHPVNEIRQIETHISNLFLTGAHVYKIKKPVDLGFLDFSSPGARERNIWAEVELNQALAPEVYIGATEIRRDASGHYAVAGPGETVEVCLHMHQLPLNRSLAGLLASGTLSQDDMERLARRIATFHEGAPPVHPPERPLADQVSTDTEDNFTVLRRFEGSGVDTLALEEIVAYTRAFIENHRRAFATREMCGRVRDCHGDLHAGNIFLTDGIPIIDRIEFSRAFRYIDVASEIAFLAMDLDRHERSDLSAAFVDAYIRASGDEDLRGLLPFFKVYRALVRGKVTLLRLNQGHPSKEARARLMSAGAEYIRLALSYVNQERPQALFLMAGLSGTGKSAVARGIAERWEARRHSSDVIRKEAATREAAAAAIGRPEPDLYAPAMTLATYEEMLRRAEAELAAGRTVVLDATFRKRGRREAACHLAKRFELPSVIVECITDEETVRHRLRHRTPAEAEGSDADISIVHIEAHDWEPIGDQEADEHVVMDTSGPYSWTINQVTRRLWEVVLRQSRVPSRGLSNVQVTLTGTH